MTARGGAPTWLALFGGAFNPPHRTHRRIAEAALQQLPVRELRVLPAGDHPHKQGRDVAPAEQRLAMCRLQFAELPRCIVDDRELHRRGPSFTVDTLQELHDEQPARPLFFVLGADNLPLLPTWRDHHRILRLCTVVTFPRLGCTTDAQALHGLDLDERERAMLLAHVLTMPADDVNATALRARLRAGERGLPELLPTVEAYIRAHHLYGA